MIQRGTLIMKGRNAYFVMKQPYKVVLESE